MSQTSRSLYSDPVVIKIFYTMYVLRDKNTALFVVLRIKFLSTRTPLETTETDVDDFHRLSVPIYL